MEDLVETLAIGLLVSVILIVISWWFWKRYDEPSEAQIEREESISKKKEETRMWRAVEAQMAAEKVTFEEQALYERRKAEERARAVPPPTSEVSNAFAAFDMERQTPVKTFTENDDEAPSAEEALIEHELEVEVDDDDVRIVDELVEVRQDQGVVFEEHQILPELPSETEEPEEIPENPSETEEPEEIPENPSEDEKTDETLDELEAPIPAAPDLDALSHNSPESASEPEWSLEEEAPVESDWSDNWFTNLDDE